MISDEPFYFYEHSNPGQQSSYYDTVRQILIIILQIKGLYYYNNYDGIIQPEYIAKEMAVDAFHRTLQS